MDSTASTSSAITEEYFSIVDASFDAGLIVDHKSRIQHANCTATELFFGGATGDTAPTESLLGKTLDHLMTIWSKHGGTVDVMSWYAVLQHAVQKENPTREWPISAKVKKHSSSDHKSHVTMVPGLLRITPLSRNLWLIFIKRTDHPEEAEVTKRLSHKARLLESRAQEIVEAALDPMFQINEHGTILMVNQAALECFHYAREELLGENISVLCGGNHGPKHNDYLKRYLETGESRIIGKYRELPGRKKDGTEFPIRLAVVELASSGGEERLFCGFIHDLTTRRRNEDIIFGTIDTSLDPVFHINDKGYIINVNQAALRHLGFSWTELLGQNVSIVVGGGHAPHHDSYIQHYLQTGDAKAIGKRRRLWARRVDGSEIPIELQLSEIKISSGEERIFCAILTLLDEESNMLDRRSE